MKVHLISYTNDPIGTVLKIWDASKQESGSFSDLPERPIYMRYRTGTEDEEDLALFRRIMAQGIPNGEHVSFNFWFEDVPIAWREQAVRHRVGVQMSDNFGVDIIPDSGTGISFWSQSMRLLDMSTFAQDGKYWAPESIENAHISIRNIYHTAMAQAEQAYAKLVAYGIPKEDARGVIPLHATHGIGMVINLRALAGIIGKRGCWILQSGYWAPIIKGMVGAMAEQIHPIFRELVYPPCIENGKFAGCKFVEENRRRETGEDDMPLCPLYVTNHMGVSKAHIMAYDPRVDERIPEYADLWNQPHLPVTWQWEDR